MFNTVSTATSRFLADLSNLEQRMVTTQRQLSSGLRMQSVADDPDQVSDLLQLNAQIAHNNQLKYNLGHVQTEVNTAEAAINTATQLMDQARKIAAQGSNSFTDTSTRAQLADQVNDLITEVFGIMNTTVEGRYVFSGGEDQAPPYNSIDLTQPNGVGVYQGSDASRTVEHPNGSTFPVSLTADQIFDGAGTSSNSVLQSLTSLYNDLTNNDVTALQVDVDNIATASNYLDGQQARYGEFQNQVSDAINFQSSLDTQLRTQLSNVQDADTVAAATALQQQTVAMQAAMQSEAAMPKKSLFDYIG